MSLWIVALILVAVIAYRCGRMVGRAQVARQAIEQFGPLLPLLDELTKRAEALGASVNADQAELLRSRSHLN